MNDELKKLKNVFDREMPVKADMSAKTAALNAAMDAFSQENSKTHQGNQIEDRLKGQGNTTGNRLVEILTLSKWRKSMKLSYFLTGSASIAVLTLAVLNSGQFQEIVEPAVIKTDTETAIIKPDKIAKETTIGDTKPQVEEKDHKANQGTLAKRENIVLPKNKPAEIAEAERQDGTRTANQQAPSSSTVPLGGLYANQGALHRSPGKKKYSKQETRLRRTIAPVVAPSPVNDAIRPPAYAEQGRDKFDGDVINPTKMVTKEPVSTFSIDVDTASYSFMRGSINRNVLPPKASVRVEEMINYFPYNYPGADNKEVPFKASVTITPTPWNTATKLVHIGIKGFEIQSTHKPRSNLVFLLDTSGSMNAPNKLPLLRNSFKLLLSTLSEDDTVSIVTYAGSAGVVLEPTRVKNKAKILASLDRLRAGGSTAGGEGIRVAYQLAQANFHKTGVNRVILATDGDFNVGIRSRSELKSFVERKRKSGVFLSVLGFGMGNYNDALMQTLAQNGNGNAAYIDSLSEARKVLVQEASSTLFTIAKDVKIQMEFNPQTVSEYRLVGYETRKLKREDFNNDKVDAGDIGSGHTVTAIYEITPVGSKAKLFDSLRYKKEKKKKAAKIVGTTTEFGFLKLRYKLPNESKSKLVITPVNIIDGLEKFANAPQDVRFATAVAAFGQLLRGGKYINDFSYDQVVELAQKAKGDDKFGYRSEFINLVRLAKSAAALQPQR